MTMNAPTMLELADDIADIPHEVNLTPRQARLLQAAANALRETAALRAPALAGVAAREAATSIIEQARKVYEDHADDNCAWVAMEDAYLRLISAALPPSQEVPALIPAGKQARFKNETTWFAVGDWHDHPHSFEYRTVYALDDPAAPPQRMWSAPAEFVMWALMEGAWRGADVDGGASQDKAVELGLIVATQYDPKKHGETAYCEPGDQWFVPSEALLAALSGKPAPPPWAREARQVADCIRDYLQNKYGTAAVQISTDGIERIYYSGIPLNDLAAALAGKPGAAHDQLSRLRQAIRDHTQGDGFWIGEILLSVLAKETGFNGSLTRPDERCRYCDEAIEPGHDCSVTRPESGGAA